MNSSFLYVGGYFEYRNIVDKAEEHVELHQTLFSGNASAGACRRPLPGASGLAQPSPTGSINELGEGSTHLRKHGEIRGGVHTLDPLLLHARLHHGGVPPCMGEEEQVVSARRVSNLQLPY